MLSLTIIVNSDAQLIWKFNTNLYSFQLKHFPGYIDWLDKLPSHKIHELRFIVAEYNQLIVRWRLTFDIDQLALIGTTDNVYTDGPWSSFYL